ncbi:MAG: hypothetical protein KJO21_13255 [Verrucomicrobiae bacterium]|nr:hypothetical protein [Verrucomicrobiae bacterium]NNJ44287.1 hypothetical protein [Akkermansiaceae bacterium]
MEQKTSWMKLTVAGMVSAFLLANCTTTYDGYGRPVQSVDPVAVAAGAVVLGAIAYSAGKDQRHDHRRYHRSHYKRHHCSRHCGHWGHR